MPRGACNLRATYEPSAGQLKARAPVAGIRPWGLLLTSNYGRHKEPEHANLLANAHCRCVVGGPVGAPEGADGHACALVLGMHELAVADVDARMREASLVCIGEE